MRNCPFCAEEIRKEAIKCKHCGEWLPAPDEHDRVDNPPGQPNEVTAASATEKEGERKAAPITGTARRKEVYVEKSEPKRYGWGWLLWLGLALAGISNVYFTDTRLYAVAGVIPFVALIPYFALRLKLLRKFDFPWKAGLAAGVAMYILSAGLFSGMTVLDGMVLKHRIQSVDEKYRGRLAAFRQHETNYEARLIREPRNARDMKQNVRTIDNLLAHSKDKRQLFHEMFDDYRQAVKGKRSKTDKKPLEQSISEISAGYDASHQKWHNSWKLLRTYYLTGNKRYYESYEKAHEDATRSATDVQARMAAAFGTAHNRAAE